MATYTVLSPYGMHVSLYSCTYLVTPEYLAAECYVNNSNCSRGPSSTQLNSGWVWAAACPSAISTRLQSERVTCLPWFLHSSGFQNFWMSRMTSDDGQRKASHAQCCPRTARCKCSILRPEMLYLALKCTILHPEMQSCTQKCSLAPKCTILHPEMQYFAPRNALSWTEMHYLAPRNTVSCSQKCSILHPEMHYLAPRNTVSSAQPEFFFPCIKHFCQRLLIYMWNFTVFVLMQLGLCFHQTQNIFSKTNIYMGIWLLSLSLLLCAVGMSGGWWGRGRGRFLRRGFFLLHCFHEVIVWGQQHLKIQELAVCLQCEEKKKNNSVPIFSVYVCVRVCKCAPVTVCPSFFSIFL